MSQTQYDLLKKEITGLRADFREFMEMFSKAYELAINEKIEKAPCKQIKKLENLEKRVAALEKLNKIA